MAIHQQNVCFEGMPGGGFLNIARDADNAFGFGEFAVCCRCALLVDRDQCHFAVIVDPRVTRRAIGHKGAEANPRPTENLSVLFFSNSVGAPEWVSLVIRDAPFLLSFLPPREDKPDKHYPRR